ncbi:acyltransferase family protein [Escherichia coli]|uniref:acyltransferase family protein n=1 Tax=Escherichia coli TaxID=562 RepID=UPI002350C05F|nr:acyltransferase [Escherichia coli]MDC7888415.1 acyltransferase [Escherichia coli]
MAQLKLNSIQVMRGIAALMVVGFHYRTSLNGVYAQTNLGDLLFLNGAFGVDLFFIISGFIIVYSTKNKVENTPLSFFIKRLFRIYPVYIIALSLLLMGVFWDFSTGSFPQTWFDWKDIVKSYLFITSDMSQPGPFYGYGLLYPSWTLIYEVYFYFVFMMCLMVSHRYRTLLTVVTITSVVIFGQLIFSGGITLDPYTVSVGETKRLIDHAKFIINPIVFDFIIGVVFAEAYIAISKDSYKKNTIGIIAVAFVIYSLSALLTQYKSGHGVMNGGMIASFLFAGLVIIENRHDIEFPRFFCHLGDLSGLFFAKYGAEIPWYPKQMGWAKFLTDLMSAYLLSLVMFNYIEKPSVMIGKRLISRLMSK